MAPGATIPASGRPRLAVTAAIGVAQILAWGSSFYLPTVLAGPLSKAMGWPDTWVVSAFACGLLVSGIVSPVVGRLIEAHGGRPVLAASALLLAAGHVVLAATPNLAVFIVAWLVLGVAMGAGLYDAAFATLGRLYGAEARAAITQVTLFAGFAATVCWPLSASLIAWIGWRGTALAYALIDLAVILPLYLSGVPRQSRRAGDIGGSPGKRGSEPNPQRRRALLLLGVAFTLGAAVMTALSINLIALLQARGIGLSVAVGLGAMIGPAQVGARALEALFGRRAHPVWTLIVSTALVALGIAMLLGPPLAVGAGFLLYGLGSGLRSITRGTVPLALFGEAGYATLLGWLALPTLLATALSPLLGAALLTAWGPDWMIGALAGAAIANVLMALPLVPLSRRAYP